VRVISGRAAVLEIGPGGGNERATAVRKDEHQVELIASVRPAKHGEGPAFKGMVCTGDRDAWRKALEVGSVWPFPLTRFHTPI
jgi:hypothetical protein